MIFPAMQLCQLYDIDLSGNYAGGIEMTKIVSFIAGLVLLLETTTLSLPPNQTEIDQDRQYSMGGIFHSDSVYYSQVINPNTPVRIHDVYSALDVNIR